MCCDEAALARRRRGRRALDDVPSRISRAEALVHMGDFSSARQALEGSALAPGSEATLNALRDPLKRPPVRRDPTPRHLAHPEGKVLFSGQLSVVPWAFRDDSGASPTPLGPPRRLAEVLQSMRTIGPRPDSPRDSGLHPSWQVDRTSETERRCPGNCVW